MRQHLTTSTSTLITIPPFTIVVVVRLPDNKATEIEVKEGDTTFSQSSLEGSTKLNPTQPQKSGEAKLQYAEGESAHQPQTGQDKDYRYLGKNNTDTFRWKIHGFLGTCVF